jgi:hypothetical protein
MTINRRPTKQRLRPTIGLLLSTLAGGSAAAGNGAGIRHVERLSAAEAMQRMSVTGKFHPTTHGCPAESSEECYGELLNDGYEQILQGMPPPGSPCALTPDSVLYDIGSGFGRLVMYARLRTNISRAVGIEINACRHRGAVRGKAALEAAAQRSRGGSMKGSTASSSSSRETPLLMAGLDLVNGDVREQSLGDATHVHMSIQCWGHELIDKIVSHLVPKAPRMRCMLFSAHAAKHVLSLPDGANLEKLDRWGVLDQVEQKVHGSWTEEGDVLYVGKRSPEFDEWRRRTHHPGKSVKQAPEGEWDAWLPDMAAEHRWKDPPRKGGMRGIGMQVLQVTAGGVLLSAALLAVLIGIGYGFAATGCSERVYQAL